MIFLGLRGFGALTPRTNIYEVSADTSVAPAMTTTIAPPPPPLPPTGSGVQPAPGTVVVDPTTLPYCSSVGCTSSFLPCTSLGVCTCNGTQCQRGAPPSTSSGSGPTPSPSPSPMPPAPVDTSGGSNSGGVYPTPTYPPVCPAGTAYDENSQFCVSTTGSCPPGQMWDPYAAQCATPGAGSAAPAAGPSVSIGPPIMIDPTTGAAVAVVPKPPLTNGQKIAIGAGILGALGLVGLAFKKLAA